MERMRDLLRASLGQSLRSLTPLDRLAAAWPVVCGPVLASRGELQTFEAGRLIVHVPDPVWRSQLRSSRERLTRELARIAGVELREIHFEEGTERPRGSTGADKGPPVADRLSRPAFPRRGV